MIDLFSLPELRLGLEETKAAMGKAVADAAPELREALDALLARDGDMLRAALVILASGFGKPEAGRMLGIAAASELLRLATSLHSGALCRIPAKGGRGADWAIRRDVLLGDFLLTRAIRMLLGAMPKGDPSLAAGVAGRICESEIEEGMRRFDIGVKPRAYLRRIHGKTALLLGASMRMAAVEAACPRPEAQALTRFGYCLGMGAQIVDDIRDFEIGREGGHRGSDLAAGLFTLPLILALKGAGLPLARLLGKPPYRRVKIAKILKLVDDSGALGHAREIADGYHRLALLELDRLPDIKARSALRETAAIVMGAKGAAAARPSS